ncbi:MAG: cupredoxin domain-containing protein [Acidobacteriota bacterium]|nr:cupredoxin domain-containing protein [Acidobacteriota bacterium]
MRLATGAAAVLIFGAAALVGSRQPRPVDRTITVEAQQYGYTPGVIKVNKGDRITLRLKAKDVTHGFFLEGYDLDAKARPEMPSFWVRRPSTGEEYRTTEEIHFVADHEGKFRYRCSVTCGYMHPFMQGELIVAPNRLFPLSILLSVALTSLSLIWFASTEGK